MPKISQSRFDRLKSAAYGHARKHGGTYKDAAIAGAAGFGLSVLSQKGMSQIEVVQKNKWVEPLVYFGGGLLVSMNAGKMPGGIGAPLGHGMCAVGGFLAGEYFLGPDSPFAEKPKPTAQPQASALMDPNAFMPAMQRAAQGFQPGDSGEFRPGDAGHARALLQPGEASGAFARMGRHFTGTRATDATSSSPLTRSDVSRRRGGEASAGDAYELEG